MHQSNDVGVVDGLTAIRFLRKLRHLAVAIR